MDGFKVLFCLFGGRKFRPTIVRTSSTCNLDRHAYGNKDVQSTANPTESKVSSFRTTQLQTRHSIRKHMRLVSLSLAALLAPIYLVGCGGANVSSKLLLPLPPLPELELQVQVAVDRQERPAPGAAERQARAVRLAPAH